MTNAATGPDSAVLVMPGEQDMMEAVSDAPDDLVLVESELPVAEPVPPVVQTQSEQIPEPAVTSPAQEPAAPRAAPSAPEPERAASAPAAEPPAGAAQAAGDHWYRQRPAGEYALQVLGTRSRQAAVDFIGKHTGVADLRYFETRHEGQPWFVVTQGAYAGREQAQQAVSRLPQPLRDQKPWPRSFGSIQQTMP